MNDDLTLKEFEALDKWFSAKQNIKSLTSSASLLRSSLEAFIKQIWIFSNLPESKFQEDGFLDYAIDHLCNSNVIPKNIWNYSGKHDKDNFLHTIRIVGNKAIHDHIAPEANSFLILLKNYENEFIKWYTAEIPNWKDLYEKRRKELQPIITRRLEDEDKELFEKLNRHIEVGNVNLDEIRNKIISTAETLRVLLEKLEEPTADKQDIKLYEKQIEELLSHNKILAGQLEAIKNKKNAERFSGIPEDEIIGIENQVEKLKSVIKDNDSKIKNYTERLHKLEVSLEHTKDGIENYKYEHGIKTKINKYKLITAIIIGAIIIGLTIFGIKSNPISATGMVSNLNLLDSLVLLNKHNNTRLGKEIAARLFDNYFDEASAIYPVDQDDRVKFEPSSAKDFLLEIYLTKDLKELKLFNEIYDPRSGKIITLEVYKTRLLQ